MLFSVSYLGQIFPRQNVTDEFEGLYDYFHEGYNAKPLDGFVDKYIGLENKQSAFYVHGPNIMGYMEYTVYYLIVNDIIDYADYFDAVESSLSGRYDAKYGVYPTIAFDDLNIADEFYRAFYECLEPIYDMYMANADIFKIREMSFSNEYRELYNLYHWYGVKGQISPIDLYNYFFCHLGYVEDDYERPSKNEVFN